jgi:hypothetical protein
MGPIWEPAQTPNPRHSGRTGSRTSRRDPAARVSGEKVMVGCDAELRLPRWWPRRLWSAEGPCYTREASLPRCTSALGRPGD